MSFLNPWIALGIAAAVIPALIFLYFLKLRRREERVPSTLLWKRAVLDLQVNAPFQRLRKNLLLLLQLLVLAAGLFAVARPIVQATLSQEERVIILIDRSASMNAEEDGQTRLDIAKEQATRRVKTINKAGSRWFSLAAATPKTQVMVIAFADRATVVSPYTTNTSELEDLIAAIEPTDGPTRISEAIELAEAYMAQTTVEINPISPHGGSEIVLFSDGRLSDFDKVVLRAGHMTWVPIGTAVDNVGITALRVERNYETPEVVDAFLRVSNFGPEAVRTDVSLLVDGRIVKVRTLNLPAGPTPSQAKAGTQPDSAETARSGATSLSFQLTLDRAGVLEARLARADALKADNHAFAVVPPPRKLHVLLVSKRSFFLESVLEGLPLEQIKYMTPDQYESAPASELESDGRSIFDVVLVDRHNTARLPIGNYLFLGALPQIAGVSADGEVEGQALIWWDETHPVLRYAVLDYVHVAKWLNLKVPDDCERLVEGPYGPVLVHYTSDGRRYLILAFAIESSTWWGHSSFPIFIYNAMRYLGSGAAGQGELSARPGETLRFPTPAGVSSIEVTRPDGRKFKVDVDETGMARFGGSHLAGLYKAAPGVEQRDTVAVNVDDEFESDIRPRDTLTLPTGAQVDRGEAIQTSTPEVWRWFIGAALLIVLLEWWVYNRRVMI